MLLQFDNGESFAIGACPYSYRPVINTEGSPRIILTVLLENSFSTSAFVDTGGVFVILSPEIAKDLGLDPKDGMPAPSLLWRGDQLQGVLHRISVTLLAEEGDSLTIEATTFVPTLSPQQEWQQNFPCILGMSGCLEFLRFAVDPVNDRFYFGE